MCPPPAHILPAVAEPLVSSSDDESDDECFEDAVDELPTPPSLPALGPKPNHESEVPALAKSLLSAQTSPVRTPEPALPPLSANTVDSIGVVEPGTTPPLTLSEAPRLSPQPQVPISPITRSPDSLAQTTQVTLSPTSPNSNSLLENSTTPTTAAASGWGGWSSLLTSAESIYSQAHKISENIKDLSIDDVYAKLDPDFKKHTTSPPTAQPTAVSPGPDAERQTFADLLDRSLADTAPPTSTNESDPNSAEGRVNPAALAADAGDSLLGTLDKTFDFASNILGNAVLGGYKTIEQANLAERLTQLRDNPETRQALDNSLWLGESAMKSSLAALENLGRSAVNVVNEKRKVNVSTTNQAGSPATALPPSENSWEGCFAKYKGPALVIVAQELTQDKTIHLESILAHADGLRDRGKDTLSQIVKLLAPATLAARETPSDASLLSPSNDVVPEELEQLLTDVGIDDIDSFRALQEISEEVEEFDEAGVGATIADFKASDTPSAQQLVLNDFHKTAYKTLAEFAVAACKQVSELNVMATEHITNFHRSPTEAGFASSTAPELAQKCQTVVAALLGEAKWLGHVYKQCADQLADEVDEIMADPVALLQAALEKDLDHTVTTIQEMATPLPVLLQLLHVDIISVVD
ncbi:hypothetical protein BJ085DRAFT_36804 [Dimargaris cristalligena]|uniref:Uncharacterized protein n=1 Tax=Dimargaris cristalligena TaxID=215637 RepID=A0A4P9ZSC9_9FUNG|nr:hypothetical protein BJ085DRAFT_36804 [Dimargaris cristalligena]|eukprot:RKP36315.1 hypothetical protein BJ085DRAFT_36804 [Dimargaris cristalligena]